MQLLRYGLAGIFNTAIGISVIYVAMYALRLNYVYANIAGYAVGIGVAFLLNRTWTFQHSGAWLSSFIRWLLVVGTAYLFNLGVIVGMRQGFGMDPYLVQAAGIFTYTTISFLGGRYFAFATPARGV
ncbi:hypothetical protein DNX69_25290 [Rhodopseudomonas palustris]|uniref:GtrA/DPMS transmembrane domain-containing protein n=1 Tax=Rhodopseudomonas palustris TaxID=1076 RepID=A0A323UAK2_RHOPL|nr:GtrA family protein [Rhodopseudomonas palustris]PZA09411.1 hypothetical protein DNX69_25290 [Rhodopseudomonas palustris]